MKIKSGGGIQSKVVSHTTKGKQEPVSHKANVGGVAAQGLAVQFKKPPLERGSGYQPYGAKSHVEQGPGAMRTLYKSGSQQPTPPVKEMPQGREILGSYGPEISGPSRRRP